MVDEPTQPSPIHYEPEKKTPGQIVEEYISELKQKADRSAKIRLKYNLSKGYSDTILAIKIETAQECLRRIQEGP
ncbi:MAG TPA: hypothetical protein VM577_08245 [Anaerovoracaceae bacterium]|nr:hypothetical protein [Anaerovoracaceae bacterium]